MDLQDYMRLLRRRWKLIALCVAVSVAAAAWVTSSQTKMYTATTKLFVSTSGAASTPDVSSAYQGALLTQQRVKSYIDIVRSVREAQLVVDDLGLDKSPTKIAQKITASAPLDEVVMAVSVSDPDPQVAQRIADSVGRTFPRLVEEIERPAVGASPVKVSMVEPPAVPTQPTSPRPKLNLALGLLVGLALGVGGAVSREVLDTRIRTREALEEVLDAPALGLLPKDPKSEKRPLVVLAEPRSVHAEAFRQLRTNLQFADVDHRLHSVVVSSAVLGEGKSTIACNLALAVAETGRRVVLVEGDLRRPRVDVYLGLERAVGLTNVLLGQVSLDEALQEFGPNELTVLPSGPLPPNPTEILGSAAMQALLERLEGLADLVVIDAPPLLPVADASVLGAMAGGVLLVVDAAETRRDAVRQAADQVRSVGATLLGAVLTRLPTKGPDAYAYGYGHGYGDKDAKVPHTGTAVLPPAPATPGAAQASESEPADQGSPVTTP